jgi:hypothetical protein
MRCTLPPLLQVVVVVMVVLAVHQHAAAVTWCCLARDAPCGVVPLPPPTLLLWPSPWLHVGVRLAAALATAPPPRTQLATARSVAARAAAWRVRCVTTL